jgi:hypothetical protein
MRDPLGAIIFAQVLAVKMIAFIHQRPVRIRIDRQRTGIDTLLDTQLLHQFQHIARPRNIDIGTLALILDANLIPARDMKNAIDTLHSCAHTLLIGHISLRNRHSQRCQFFRLRRRARAHYHLVTLLYELASHMATFIQGRGKPSPYPATK